MKKIHIIGPSGAGKSFVLDLIRQAKLASTFDLDFVGYRKKNQTWKDWTINPSIYGLLAHNSNEAGVDYVIAGCDSHTAATVKASREAGFMVVALIPSVSVIAKNRNLRHDPQEKVSESSSSVQSWMEHARVLGLDVFASTDEFVSSLEAGSIPSLSF